METTLVRQAVANLRAMNDAWDAYTGQEGEPPVRPALVVSETGVLRRAPGFR